MEVVREKEEQTARERWREKLLQGEGEREREREREAGGVERMRCVT